MSRHRRPRLAIVSTGGTIEKTYDAMDGVLQNEVSVLDIMLARLTLSIDVVRVPLMNKDSLEMSEADHVLIAQTAAAMAQAHDGVVIVHGTDRLERTGEVAYDLIDTIPCPIVLTGAMRPYELRSTDAMQNLTEALLAAQILPPGIYCVMHNRVLSFPNVTKDRDRLTFVNRPGPWSDAAEDEG